MMISPADLLQKSAETFKLRNAIYGENYVAAGKVLDALFPLGISCGTAKEHEKFHLLMLLVVKLTRYCNNYNVGHDDSLDDLAVYAAMLRAIDQERAKEDEIPF